MAGQSRNANANDDPPPIQKLPSVPLPKARKKPDRMYSQYIADSVAPATVTKLQTLREDAINPEIRITVDHLNYIAYQNRKCSGTAYLVLREALETPVVHISSSSQEIPAPAKTTHTTRVNNGLDYTKPPISDIDEIFDSLTADAISLGLQDATKEFVGDEKGIRIVTMCSGTESPVIGLIMTQQVLQRLGKEHFNILHLGACEIEAFKQAFIERNWTPPRLYRDVTEFTEHKKDPRDPAKLPRTAYGATADIPVGAHILVAGSSCVDHSALNNHANKADGESAQTLLGVADYADLYRPVLVLLENVALADWEDQVTFWADRNYYFRALKVDSKNFYIPQTRERGYSIAIDEKHVENFIEDSDLCPRSSCGAACSTQRECDKLRDERVKDLCKRFYKEWMNSMTELQQRASSPFTDFLLREDDARLQAAKAMTENTKPNKGNSDWKKCQKRHTRARAEDLLGTKRPFTNREGNGRPKLDERYWRDWCLGRTTREQDVLDISALRYVVAGDLDMRYKSRNIDITQNIDRDVDSRAWGLVGCITPKGCLFETRRGGPIIGLEALALQGMPIDNLDLTKASLRQMQDLAGNAMTTTVITASILSAFIASHKTFASLKSDHETLFQKYSKAKDTCDVKKVGALGYDYVDSEESSKLVKSDGLASLSTPSPGNDEWGTMIKSASKSQRLCLCESLGQHTNAAIKYCRKCSYTCCEDCSTSPHDDFEKLILNYRDREAADDFISRLTKYLPGVVKFSGFDGDRSSAISEISETLDKEEDFNILKEALKQALNHDLRFQGVKYEETWKAVYDSQTARLELQFPRRTEGSTNDSGIPDVHPVWWLFGKCPAGTPVTANTRNLLKHPIARMYPGKKACFEGVWELWNGFNKDIEINIESVGPLKEAWEAKLGLQGDFYPKLKIPKQLEVECTSSRTTGDDAGTLQQLDGTYKLLEKCPAPYGWLYVRENLGSSQDNSIYFYLNAAPIGEPSDDRMEFGTSAPSITSTDDRNILLRLDEEYIPTLTESNPLSKSTTVQGSLARRWSKFEDLKLKHADPPAKFFVQPESSVHTQFKSCAASFSTMFLVEVEPKHDEPKHVLLNFPEGRPIKLQLENKPGALKAFKWLISYAAMIPELENSDIWHQISSSADDARCHTCVPTPPTLSWVELELEDNKKKTQTKQKLLEDAGQAKDYEQAMKARPLPVSAIISRENGKLCLWIQVNVVALMHRAVAELSPTGRHSRLEWRLRRLPPFAARPKFESLKFHSNANMKPATSDLDPPLWTSQLKTLAWMMEKESTESTWSEEILKEACIPSLGWCLEVKASRNPGVRGGVLADKVGAGKTKTTLELIRQDLRKLKQDKSKCFPHSGIGTHISTEATLILVPNNLIQQWKREVRTVMEGMELDWLVLESAQGLKDSTIDKFKSAEIILAPLSLFEEEEYWEHHRMVACAPNVPEKAGRAFDEYLNDSLSNLAMMIEASKDGIDKDAFWKEWREARNSIGEYKRFSGVKTRASKKAAYKKARNATATGTTASTGGPASPGATTATGAQKRTRSTTQSSGSIQPRKKTKAATTGSNSSAQALQAPNATTSSTTKNEWVVISDEAFEKGEKANFDKAADVFEENGKMIPVFHMFNFRRLVVDEFSYVQATSLAALLRMKATSRWLLSGTPPVHDYDSVNTIAKLLGTKLSAVDEMNGVHDFVKGPKRDAKLKSQSEEFQEHQDVGSPAFLNYLYARSQELSEEFIRQDESSQAKKGKTHKMSHFSGNISELLDYANAKQILETEDCRFNVKLDPKKLRGMAVHEVRQQLRQSRAGPREALICSMSDLATSQQLAGNSPKLGPQTIMDALCERILNNCRTLLQEMQELWYCYRHAWEPKSRQSFDAFLFNFENLAVLDLDPCVVPLIDRLLSYAKSNPEMPESTLKVPAQMPKQAQTEKAKWDAQIATAKAANNAFRMLLPFYQSKEMDERTTRAESLIEDIVAEFRRARFVRFAMDVNQGETQLGKCSHCNNEVDTIDNVEVSGGCGHVLSCSNCPEAASIQDNCINKDCSAYVGHVWPASFFYTDGSMTQTVTDVTRMQKAIDIIEAVPEREFVLVFVQFDNMAGQFLEACRASGITYKDATNSQSKGTAATIGEFQKAIKQAEKLAAQATTDIKRKSAWQGASKVLLLQIDSEDAAGWNLQCANHVVFLAPFVGESAEVEWDTMAQAVGRAHRPGQEKPVVVYHIYAVDTIEAGVVREVAERFEKEA